MDDAQLQGHFAAIDERFDRFEAFVIQQFEAMKAYVDERISEVLSRQEALEKRVGGLEERVGALEKTVGAMDRKFDEKFIGVSERFGSMRLAQEQFERRVQAAIAANGASIGALREDVSGLRDGLGRLDERMGAVESNLLRLNERVDGLARNGQAILRFAARPAGRCMPG